MLIEYGDGLLDTPYGLADDPNCCCTDDSSCPPCCIEITSGALIDGEIKIFNSDGTASWEITITTPSGTRQVCADDGITIRVETFIDGLLAPVGAIEIAADAAWYFGISSGSGAIPPSDGEQQVGSNNSRLPGAWVYWEGESDVSAEFLFTPCFFNQHAGLGAIEIRINDWPESAAADVLEVIAVSRSQPTVQCCRVPSVCGPCCRTFEPSGAFVDSAWGFDGNRFKKLVILEIGSTTYNIVFWLVPSSLDDPSLICLTEEGTVLTAGVDIGPADAHSATAFDSASATFSFCEFGHINDPATSPGSGVVTEGPPLEVEWTNEDSLTFQSSFKYDCENLGCDAITLSVTVNTTDDGSGTASTTIVLDECEDEGDCCESCMVLWASEASEPSGWTGPTPVPGKTFDPAAPLPTRVASPISGAPMYMATDCNGNMIQEWYIEDGFPPGDPSTWI